MRKIGNVLRIILILAISISVAGCAALDVFFGGPEDPGTNEPDNEGPVDLTGTTVTIEGVFRGDAAANFEASLVGFEDETGITIEYTGSDGFEGDVRNRVTAPDAPDIVILPQPGLLGDLATDGHIQDLAEWFDASFIYGQYDQAWQDLSQVGGLQAAGFWYRVSVKSLVWYNTAVFATEGYQIPTTWDELLTLSGQMVTDGYTPWSIGIESGEATGWPATDWIEDVMLRLHPTSDYDDWVDGTLAFDSTEVRAAIAEIENIWSEPGWVLQTPTEITTTPFGDAVNEIAGQSPNALMHRQASFASGYLEDAVGETVDAFYLPPITTTAGGNGLNPVLGAGDVAAAVADRPEVRAVMEHLASAASVEHWIRQGGAISPHLDVDPSWYPTIVQERAAEIIGDADVFRFDGSDLMPSAVGSDAFWTEITSYIAGDQDLDTTLANIDAAWPTE